MLNLYGGVKNTQFLARCTKIENFFSEHQYISENQAVHMSELKKNLLTNEDINTAFFTLLYNNKTIKTAAKDYFYLDMEARYRPKRMLTIIFGSIALATLILIIFTIIAFAAR